jgi:hypothetical protein
VEQLNKSKVEIPITGEAVTSILADSRAARERAIRLFSAKKLRQASGRQK